MTAVARRLPAPLALWLALLASVALFPLAAVAQSGASSAQPYGQPYSDPYKSGPTRPLDGSPRSGVYATNPVPSYETPRRNLSAADGVGDIPAIWRGLYIGRRYLASNNSRRRERKEKLEGHSTLTYTDLLLSGLPAAN